MADYGRLTRRSAGRHATGKRAVRIGKRNLMLATYRKLLDLMTPAERRRFYGILGIIMFSGLAEMLSVAAILPFMAVLADPDILERSHRLAAVYHGLGFASRESFLVFLGVGVFCRRGLRAAVLDPDPVPHLPLHRHARLHHRQPAAARLSLPALHLVPEPAQLHPRRQRALGSDQRGQPGACCRR